MRRLQTVEELLEWMARRQVSLRVEMGNYCPIVRASYTSSQGQRMTAGVAMPDTWGHFQDGRTEALNRLVQGIEREYEARKAVEG